MFNFLSLFKRNTDGQLADNEYDFNETPGVDGQREMENPAPVLFENVIGSQHEQAFPTRSSRDELLREQARQAAIAGIRNKINDLPNCPSENVHNEITPDENPLKQPDLELVLGYPEEEVRMRDNPGVTEWHNGKKGLYFVSAKHGGDINNPTHKTVATVIDANNPNLVVTEGHGTDMTPEQRLRVLEENRKAVEFARLSEEQKAAVPDSERPYLPESGYAAYLASQKDIPFVGGELTGLPLFKKLEEHGYTATDLLASQFMREIHGMRDAGKLKNMTEDEFIAQYADQLLRKNRIDTEEGEIALTFGQFKDWYQNHPLPNGRSFMDASNDDFSPHVSKGADQIEFLQQMSKVTGLVRDQHIASLLYDQFKTHDKVVMIYGAAHLKSLRPALDQMFGTAGKFTQLFPEEGQPIQTEPSTPEPEDTQAI